MTPLTLFISQVSSRYLCDESLWRQVAETSKVLLAKYSFPRQRQCGWCRRCTVRNKHGLPFTVTLHLHLHLHPPRPCFQRYLDRGGWHRITCSLEAQKHTWIIFITLTLFISNLLFLILTFLSLTSTLLFLTLTFRFLHLHLLPSTCPHHPYSLGYINWGRSCVEILRARRTHQARTILKTHQRFLPTSEDKGRGWGESSLCT